MSGRALPRFRVTSVEQARALPPFVDRAAMEVDARASVEPIVADVAERGDAALAEWAEKLDGARPSRVEPDGADSELSEEARGALELAAERIERFHRRTAPRRRIRADDVLRMSRVFEPFARVGLYVPGGRAVYPSTMLMLAIPARVAGVAETVVVTPPRPDGSVSPAVRCAASLAGVGEMWAVGGAHAVAALAFGTASIRGVEAIVGPGNRYVTAAKAIVSDRVAIDLPAGPSEIAIVADGSTDPALAAADALAQLEHDPDARALVVATDAAWLDAVDDALESRVETYATGATIRAAMRSSAAIEVPDPGVGTAVVSAWAAEHVALLVADPGRWLSGIRGAGATFVGARTPVALGDYLAGPNHTLPTGGAGRFRSGLGVEAFGRWTSVVDQAPAGETAAPLLAAAAVIADLEGLPAHAASLRARLTAGAGRTS